MSRLVLAALLITAVLFCPQGPIAAANADELAAFRALPAAMQSAVLEATTTALRTSADPGVQRIVALAAEATALRPCAIAGYFTPREFAPVAPTRTVITEGSPQQVAQRNQFPQPPFLRNLPKACVYDWTVGKLGSIKAPTVEQRFAALLHGLPPGSDLAVALLLERFDADAEQRNVAAWFEHTYADLDGHVFEGITLYEAWYSGRKVEVPDVDAIAFARTVLHTDSFVSPIPDGRRRDRLYQQIQAAFSSYREYRTLREAAAAAFVTVDPDLDPTYRELTARLHFLWLRLGYAPDRVAQKLNGGDRSELLEVIDSALRNDPTAASLRATAQSELMATAAIVRAAVTSELHKAIGK
jgi:hypothetical protein